MGRTSLGAHRRVSRFSLVRDDPLPPHARLNPRSLASVVRSSGCKSTRGTRARTGTSSTRTIRRSSSRTATTSRASSRTSSPRDSRSAAAAVTPTRTPTTPTPARTPTTKPPRVPPMSRKLPTDLPARLAPRRDTSARPSTPPDLASSSRWDAARATPRSRSSRSIPTPSCTAATSPPARSSSFVSAATRFLPTRRRACTPSCATSPESRSRPRPARDGGRVYHGLRAQRGVAGEDVGRTP